MSDLSSGFYKLFDKSFTDEIVGLPCHFDRLESIIHGFQRSRYWLLGGLSGSGKTAFADEMFVLDVFDWWYSNFNCDESKFKISWIYNSMERNKDLKIAKWAAMKLYKDTNDVISTATMTGATKFSKDPKLVIENELKRKHKDLIASYHASYFKEMSKHMHIRHGSINPTGMHHFVKDFAKKHGTYSKDADGGPVYTYHHPNHYVFVISDHVGENLPTINWVKSVKAKVILF